MQKPTASAITLTALVVGEATGLAIYAVLLPEVPAGARPLMPIALGLLGIATGFVLLMRRPGHSALAVTGFLFGIVAISLATVLLQVLPTSFTHLDDFHVNLYAGVAAITLMLPLYYWARNSAIFGED